jgi:hypothetical protein
MIDLVSVHYSAQRDELSSLFSDVQHTLHLIKEYQDFRDADDREKGQQKVTATVVAMMFEVFQNVMSWHFVEKALHDFVNAAARAYHDDLRSGKARPQEYILTFSILEELVHLLLTQSLMGFSAFHVHSRTFTNNQERRRRQKIGSERARETLGYRSPVQVFQQDRLLCLLDYLMRDYRNVPKVLVELQRYSGRENKPGD